MFKFNDKIFNMFKEISKRFRHLEKDVGVEIGLNQSEAKVITCLAVNEKLSHTQLGKMCNTDKAAMSRLLVKMQEKELIKSSFSDNNKKTLYSKLTELGKKISEKIKTAFEEHIKKYFAQLNEAEAKILFNLCGKLLIEQN